MVFSLVFFWYFASVIHYSLHRAARDGKSDGVSTSEEADFGLYLLYAFDIPTVRRTKSYRLFVLYRHE